MIAIHFDSPEMPYANDQEYKQYDTLEYKRATVPTQKSLYVDNVKSTLSQTTQNYILNDIFTTTTSNTYKS